MNMDLLLVLFIGFASLIVAFAVFYIAFEMIKDTRAHRVAMKEAEAQRAMAMAQMQQASQPVAPTVITVAAPQVAPQPVAQEEAPAVEEKKEEQPVAETNDDNNVSFNAVQTQTLEEKYNLLPVKYQKYYDEIAKYAASIEGHKVIKNNRYEEYKMASARLVRLLIKRGTVIAEFIFSNFDFKNYASENKVSVKQAPTAIKIVDEEAVKVAKDSIDICIKTYFDEKEMKKELAKEKRKAKKEQ